MTASPQELPSLPPELYDHMRDLPPESYAFGRELDAANELARETGHALLTMEKIFPPQTLSSPGGFSLEVIKKSGAELPVAQFEHIKSLTSASDVIRADVHHLVTDQGDHIRYCDLRPLMTANVRSGGPTTEKQVKALDRKFYNDLKAFAEIGHPLNTVEGVKGVNYTKLGGTKARAYWMAVTDNNAEGVPTVARLADCGDSVTAEHALYNRVFDRRM